MQIGEKQWTQLYRELVEPASGESLKGMWNLLMRVDFSNTKDLENQIYSYGRSLQATDLLGRQCFRRMIELLSALERAR